MKLTTEGPAGRFKKVRVTVEFAPEEVVRIPDALVHRIVCGRLTSDVLAALTAALEILGEGDDSHG